MNIVIWTAIITAASTLIFNVLFQLLKNQFDWFVDKKRFKREHAYKQLTELYFEIYGILAQSEYIRYFTKKSAGIDHTIYEVPFIEWVIEKQFVDKETQELIKITKETAITEFNNSKIDDLVIKNAKYASSNLLKLCVAHRFCKSNMNLNLDSATKTAIKDQEVDLLREIVKTIIIETNVLLEINHMNVHSEEKASGIMSTVVFKK